MSASSSSDFECDFQYNNYSTYTPTRLLYPELGHPLIYYAQVQKRQRTQPSGKVNNNCFLKAFRWYTEEHVPLNKMESGTRNEDIQGFATWLDQKYDEFIRKSQMAHIASSQYLQKKSSMVRTNKLAHIVHETSVPRKNKMKSPWRRRQKYLNKQNGDTAKKSDQSIEMILNPKSLSRSPSECHQKFRRSNISNTVDINTPKTLKSKSESIIYILKEKEMYAVPSDDNDTTFDKKNRNNDTVNVNNGLLNIKNRPTKDISCQCSIGQLEKVDASSQFSHTKTSNVCDCVESYTKVANERMKCFNVYCSCIESHSGLCQRVLIEEPSVPLSTFRPSAMSQKSVPNTHSAIASRQTSFLANTNIGKNEPSFSVNGIAQTSDHAINLPNDINSEYPIFLKIICTQK